MATPRSSAALRPLGLPRPLQVRTDDRALPREVSGTAPQHATHQQRAPLRVERVEEVWRIAEEWWREAPIGRTYYRVIVDGGRPLTIFRDREGGRWYEQRY